MGQWEREERREGQEEGAGDAGSRGGGREGLKIRALMKMSEINFRNALLGLSLFTIFSTSKTSDDETIMSAEPTKAMGEEGRRGGGEEGRRGGGEEGRRGGGEEGRRGGGEEEVPSQRSKAASCFPKMMVSKLVVRTPKALLAL